MKANELRIGNWIIQNGYDEAVDGVRYADHSLDEVIQVESETIGYVEDEPEFFDPIPLTEEWLIKFGFKKEESNGLYVIYESDDVDIVWHGESLCFESIPMFTNEKALKHIKSVHQLQNLYFALTGTELEIK